jgi:hypothetical protein
MRVQIELASKVQNARVPMTRAVLNEPPGGGEIVLCNAEDILHDLAAGHLTDDRAVLCSAPRGAVLEIDTTAEYRQYEWANICRAGTAIMNKESKKSHLKHPVTRRPSDARRECAPRAAA